MFVYCGNNPVFRYDGTGELWLELGIGLGVSVISGLFNGYSSYMSGGKFWPAFGIGCVSGLVGYGLSLATSNPLMLVSIRGITSTISNIATTVVNNGKITVNDLFVAGFDGLMDSVFSTFIYYYNPLSGATKLGNFLSNTFNATLDGITDTVETWLYGNKPKSSATSRPHQSPSFSHYSPIRPSYPHNSNQMIMLY